MYLSVYHTHSVSWESGGMSTFFRLGRARDLTCWCKLPHSLSNPPSTIWKLFLSQPPYFTRGPFRSTTLFGRDMTLRRNLGRCAWVVKLEIGRKSCCFFGQWHCPCWGFPLVKCFRMFLFDAKPLVFRSLSVPSWKENWHILRQEELNKDIETLDKIISR